MPRTGTTWLQTQVFPRHSGIEFHHLYDWPSYVGLAQKPLRKVRLVSSEWISQPHGGWARLRREAAVLRQIFGDATILLTVRDPDEWLESIKRYMVANAIEGYIDPEWGVGENHAEVWRELFSDVHMLRLGEADYLAKLAHILGVEPFQDIDMTPVHVGARGWRYRALKALNTITGQNHYKEGIRPHAWPRRWLYGRRA